MYQARSLGLAVIEKSRIRQRARLTRIRLGDANTKFFHLTASSRARKNYIQYLQPTIGNLAVAHNDKEKTSTVLGGFLNKITASHII